MFFAIGNLLWFVLAILIGAVVTALITVALKAWTGRAPDPRGTDTASASVATDADAPARAEEA